jgi:HTH-type transcriptional regulator/antitoxin HigA
MPDALGDRYFNLVNMHPLRPIRSDDDLDQAVAMIDSLIDRDELDPSEADYLDVLSGLVEKYEAENHPLAAVSESDMLRHLIEARDVTQARVSEGTGIAESTISAILSGKRGLSRNHIAALARYFKVSPAVFIAT